MKALVLAAGQGTRLRPLTDNVPKCLIELNGVSLLERQVKALKQSGVRQVTVLAGYRANEIEKRGYNTIINPDYETTNMVQTLFCARELMTGESDLIISYGDIVCEPRVIESLMKSTSPVSVVVDKNWREYWEVRMDDPLSDAETLKLDSNGNIIELGKKAKSFEEIQGQYIGLIKIRKEYLPKFVQEFDNMDRDSLYDGQTFQNMYMTSFVQHLINEGWQVTAVEVNNGWLEVDTVEDLQIYHNMSAKDKLNKFYSMI